ncbi:ligand-binding sensor domain-containing diguanylate cyclase [Aquimonas voraii]|uniref:ligand-binding sensor domain-containing diguanylate cyclase n=1 Tax=Aquimonas voraii TaxID=265719 RepID=UPI00115FED29|nr:ligand-binding sensor domain-containing diguanylate cyclase [Aquimonas voraii]
MASLALVLGLMRGALADSPVPRPLDQYNLEVWTTREGLPHNTVNAIVQSPDGYLWLGTWEGAVRYSGLRFQNFDYNAGTGMLDSGVRALALEPGGGLLVAGSRGGIVRLADGRWERLPAAPALVTEVLRDRSGRLWAGTENGGLMRVGTDGTREHFSVSPETGGGSVYALAEDALGRIWVGTSRGLMRAQDERLLPAPDREGAIGERRVLSLLLGPQGHLLVGTERGLFSSRQPVAAAADPDLAFEAIEPELAASSISRLLRDRHGQLWIGTISEGLFRRSGAVLDSLDTLSGLPNNRVLALFEDREGNLWVGTNGGLVRLGSAPFSSLVRRHGLADDFVRSLLELPDGSLLVGTSHGLSRINGHGVRPWPEPGRGSGQAGELAELSVLSLARSARGVWIGSYQSGALRVQDSRVAERLDRASGLPSNEVRALLETEDGALWIGTTHGLVLRRGGAQQLFLRSDGLPGDYIVSLFEDSEGDLWVGTGTGLGRIRAGEVETIDLGGELGVESVFAMHEDQRERALWLATDRGLLRWRRSDGRIAAVGHAAGLPFEKFFAVLQDAAGDLWLTGNRGVLRVPSAAAHAHANGSGEAVPYEQFTEADGMASAQCNGGSSPAAVRRGDDSLWIATAQGVAYITPARLDDFAEQAPPVVIESVLVDGHALAPSPALQLPAGTGRIEIGFTGLAFVMPQRVRYRYRLEGFDEDWVERGEQRSAVFTNLGPGEYSLRVQAAHPNGPWSEGSARIDFEIAPQLWQRPWAWLLLAAGAALFVQRLLQRRLRRVTHNELRLRELVEQRTADLRLQAQRLQEADREKNQLMQQLRQQADAFERQAREDALTGLANRRAFDELLAYEFARAGRSEQPLCVALVDLDQFKRVNDELSHAAGDAVLRAVAERMRALCRDIDTVARWGGEEFALLLPNTRLSDALAVCERVRAGIERLELDMIAPGLRITISIGLASHEGHADYDRMLSQADAALYSAKQSGRNRVAC